LPDPYLTLVNGLPTLVRSSDVVAGGQESKISVNLYLSEKLFLKIQSSKLKIYHFRRTFGQN